MARRRGVVLGLFLCLAVAGFTALGLWQLQRRAWKLDLIDRVEARLAAAPHVEHEPRIARDDTAEARR